MYSVVYILFCFVSLLTFVLVVFVDPFGLINKLWWWWWHESFATTKR